MRIWHFSDTHGFHDGLIVPENIDIAIFSGDAANARDKWVNESAMREFLHWYSNVDIPIKIMIAGNHDASIEGKVFSEERNKDFSSRGIIYLENSAISLFGLKIWGSPYSPMFGEWSFMKSRTKLDRVWNLIPDDVDILVTHTPPKGVLDLAEDRNHRLERCGCGALWKRVRKLDIKAHLFGHIHNNGDIKNAGTLKLEGSDTIYSNGTVVTDARFGKELRNGNIIEIDINEVRN